MVEWFQSIWTWFVTHKDEIVIFFTSTNFVSFVSAIALLIRQIRATKRSTSTVNSLSDTLNTANKLAGDVSGISTTLNKTVHELPELKQQVAALQKKTDETLETLTGKVNAILDVQAIVYSGMKDDTARKNIANIVTTAKLSENAVRADLEKQIEDLKSKLADKVKETVEEVDKVADEVKKTVAKKPTVSRY